MKVKKSFTFGTRCIFVSLIMSMLLLTGCAESKIIEAPENQKELNDQDPVYRKDGEPFRVALIDEGPPIESSYQWYMGLCRKFKDMGYLPENLNLDDVPEDLEEFYEYVNENNNSQYLQFEDTFYFITEDNKEELAETLANRVDGGQIDIFIVTGTMPGTFLKKMNYSVPFLVSFASDPVASGIIDSVEDTGDENIWALVEDDPFARQFMAYANNLNAQKIGILALENYDDIAGLQSIQNRALDMNVEYEIAHVPEVDATEDDVKAAVQNFINSDVDAIYVLYGIYDMTDLDIMTVVDMLEGTGIPLLMCDGDEKIANGGMLMFAMFDYESYGERAAEVADRVFHNEKAGAQETLYMSTPKIQLNISSAKKIGWNLNYEFLQSVDIVYGEDE